MKYSSVVVCASSRRDDGWECIGSCATCGGAAYVTQQDALYVRSLTEAVRLICTPCALKELDQKPRDGVVRAVTTTVTAHEELGKIIRAEGERTQQDGQTQEDQS